MGGFGFVKTTCVWVGFWALVGIGTVTDGDETWLILVSVDWEVPVVAVAFTCCWLADVWIEAEKQI